MVDINTHNATEYADKRTVAWFSNTDWTDFGEQRALAAVAAASRGGRILDLGVGTGRTTAMLTLLSDDYLGIDYTPGMIEQAQRRFPNVELHVGDARHLNDLENESTDLVVFSFNGLDSLDHQGRQEALNEMVRVVRLGGHVVYSVLNIDGSEAKERPWRFPKAAGPAPTKMGRWLVDSTRRVVSMPKSLCNIRAVAEARTQGDGWAMLPLSFQNFALLAHFSTVHAAREEMTSRGMEVLDIFDTEGHPVDDQTQQPWFHVVARRTTSSPAAAAPTAPDKAKADTRVHNKLTDSGSRYAA